MSGVDPSQVTYAGGRLNLSRNCIATCQATIRQIQSLPTPGSVLNNIRHYLRQDSMSAFSLSCPDMKRPTCVPFVLALRIMIKITGQEEPRP